MQCEMCGSEGELVEALIEGSRMRVCRNCASYGKILKEFSPKLELSSKKKEKFFEIKEEPEVVEVLVPDFGARIRKAREKLGLNQKEFALRIRERESLVHKMETGEFHPSLKNARKIEKILNIKLVTQYEEEKKVFNHGELPEMTLGDLFKRK
ncbi:multiprotein bridging factor aMBF1 [Candidatus Woesearchaeota archaeon]|nr:multiprotein bridging factor aMBF1 [Candidatus Woesearchaeota archaeon]MBW3016853.1 multiprotein bridging factor aMBF1 [Candidatus Woesearchaeota archaeon]